MQSTGGTGRIQITSATHTLLENHDDDFESLGVLLMLKAWGKWRRVG